METQSSFRLLARLAYIAICVRMHVLCVIFEGPCAAMGCKTHVAQMTKAPKAPEKLSYRRGGAFSRPPVPRASCRCGSLG